MPAKKTKASKAKKARDAKPSKEESCRHQAVKELVRTAKLIKTLLMRKCVRKCKLLKEDSTNVNKYVVAQKHLALLKEFSQDCLQPVAHDIIYGQEENPLDDLKNWPVFSELPEAGRSIVEEIMQQKAFREVLGEQREKILKAKIPYKSKRQRQIEESALRKEAEGETVRQKHKQNVGIFIGSLEEATVTDVMPVVRRENKGTKGVPRHLRPSHIEERKRQRQPDLSSYGPLSSADENKAKVSHGNRISGNANKKFKTSEEKKSAVSNDEWKKAGMHPSWVAKQKQKEQSATIGAISLSTKSGNKITFSDD